MSQLDSGRLGSVHRPVSGRLFVTVLIVEPNPDDPLNEEAATLLKEDPETFRRRVDAL